jgi:hypothetical protein
MKLTKPKSAEFGRRFWSDGGGAYLPEHTCLCPKRDCAYFSSFTETCDYVLLEFHRRRSKPGKNGCKRYKKREQKRTWMKFTNHGKERRTHSAYVPENTVGEGGKNV